MVQAPKVDGLLRSGERNHRSAVLALRGVVFVFIGAFMLLSPASRHLLPREQYIKYTRGWKFFRSYGTGICDVRYELGTGAGREPLDRYELLGFDEDHRKAPMWLRRIRHGNRAGNAHVDRVTSRVCRALGPDADRLYVTARCANRDGWYDVYFGNEPICPTYSAGQSSSRPPRVRNLGGGRRNEGRSP